MDEDIEREQKHLVSTLELEEERWKNKDQRPTRTKESVIASIVEEYRQELVREKENLAVVQSAKRDQPEVKPVPTAIPIRKEPLLNQQQPGGILKRPAAAPVEAVSNKKPPHSGSPRTVDIPVTVLDRSADSSRLSSKSDESSKRVLIVEKFEKVTEERRVNGRVEVCVS